MSAIKRFRCFSVRRGLFGLLLLGVIFGGCQADFPSLPSPLQASESELVFSSMKAGQSWARPLNLTSWVRDGVEILAFELHDPDGVFSLESPPAVPFHSAYSVETPVMVRYTRYTEDPHHGLLRILYREKQSESKVLEVPILYRDPPSLQGRRLGVFYQTIHSPFHRYHLPPTPEGAESWLSFSLEAVAFSAITIHRIYTDNEEGDIQINLNGQSLPLQIKAGEKIGLGLLYRPSRYRTPQKYLVIESDDTLFPRVEFAFVPSLCQIKITPSLERGLSFLYPSQHLQQEVVITNTGTAGCSLEGVQLPFSTKAFSVLSEPLPNKKILAPSHSWRFTVRYHPEYHEELETTLSFDFAIHSTTAKMPVRVVESAARSSSCQWHVFSDTLDFEQAAPQGKVRKTLSLYNIGKEECLVSLLRMQILDSNGQPSSVFSFLPIPPSQETALIKPGDPLILFAEFSPTALGDERARWVIEAERGQQLTISLLGRGESPCIAAPESVEMRHPESSCKEEEASLLLEHTGAEGCPAEIQIQDILLQQIEAGAFTLRDTIKLPLLLRRGESKRFVFRQKSPFPAERFAYFSAVYERSPGVVRKTSTFLRELPHEKKPLQRESFTQVEQPKRDTLFVLHPNLFFQRRAKNIMQNFTAYASEASRLYEDIQVGVISSDITGGSIQAGCLHRAHGARSAIARTHEEGMGVFEKDFLLNISLPLSSSLNQSMEAVKRALSPEALAPTGCNAGFLRPNARLEIIFISDQEDTSPMPVKHYIDFLKSVKGFRSFYLLRVHSIVGGNGCWVPEGFISPAPRLIELQQQFGGVFESFCTPNWVQALFPLSAISYNPYRREFFLQGNPLPSSLRVFIDGREMHKDRWESNWAHSSETRSIVFGESSTPPPNSLIEVEYEPVCARILPD